MSIIINQKPKETSMGPCHSAYVTYSTEKEALMAIIVKNYFMCQRALTQNINTGSSSFLL